MDYKLFFRSKQFNFTFIKENIMCAFLMHTQCLEVNIGNNRDNCRGNVTHKQSICKQISYRFYKKIASFNLYFYKEDFLNWLLDLEDLFDYENIYGERKVELVLYKLSEYVLHWWEQIHSLIESDKVKTKFINGLG